MSFLEFLEGFKESWILSDGFLPLALNDPTFPNITNRAILDLYLMLRNADLITREEARWFWDEYQESEDQMPGGSTAT